MSNERIDHAAEAQRLLASDGSEHGDIGFGQMTNALQAQVHATLALAEQMRIANLLRSGAIGGGPMSDHYPGYVQSYLWKEWPDIAAALGLETP